MIEVYGTKSKSLLAYIDRVADYLELDAYDAFYDINIVRDCAGGAGGYCNGDEDIVDIEIARNDSAGKIPMKDMMINIAHEMVHAQQMASGRLINKGFVFRTDETNGDQVLTTKQIFEGKEYIGVEYNDQPWEIEAYKLEKEIYNACKS